MLSQQTITNMREKSAWDSCIVYMYIYGTTSVFNWQVYKYNEHKVKQTLCALHKSHKGVSKSRAQTMLVQEASLVHKSHLYRLRLNKSQPKQTHSSALSICNNVWMAVGINGVQLFHVSSTKHIKLSKLLMITELWSVNKPTWICILKQRRAEHFSDLRLTIIFYHPSTGHPCVLLSSFLFSWLYSTKHKTIRAILEYYIILQII